MNTQATMTTAALNTHTMFNKLNMKALRKSKMHKASVIVSTLHAEITFRDASDIDNFVLCFGSITDVRACVKLGFIDLKYTINGNVLHMEADCFSIPGLHQNTAVFFTSFLRTYASNTNARTISGFDIA